MNGATDLKLADQAICIGEAPPARIERLAAQRPILEKAVALDPSRSSLAGGIVYMFQIAGGSVGQAPLRRGESSSAALRSVMRSSSVPAK